MVSTVQPVRAESSPIFIFHLNTLDSVVATGCVITLTDGTEFDMTEHTCCSNSCSSTATASPSSAQPPLPPGTQALRLHIEAMDCPTEEGLLRRAFENRPDIVRLDFDLIGRVLTVHHRDAVEEDIFQRIASTGMTAERYDATRRPTTDSEPEQWWKLGAATLLALAAEASHWLDLAEPWLAAVLALLAIALVGLPTWKKGFIALRHRALNINEIGRAHV